MEEESNLKEQEQQTNSSTRDNASQTGEITEILTLSFRLMELKICTHNSQIYSVNSYNLYEICPMEKNFTLPIPTTTLFVFLKDHKKQNYTAVNNGLLPSYKAFASPNHKKIFVVWLSQKSVTL